MTVSPEGAEYVHRQVETPAFLAELIALFQENHHCSLEEICRVFGRYSEDYTCERMAEDSDFDYVIFFQDPSIDEYFYCIKAEMGHTIYHRFTRADYLAL